MSTDDLVRRLLALEVSALCDADKTLPVLDLAIRAMVPDVRMAGRAYTVVAEDDHLPVMTAVAEAEPGDVLVIATNGHRRAVLGELFAGEARRRGLQGVVIDGFCRDVASLRRIGLPVFARGVTPCSGTAVSRAHGGQTIDCGGLEVSAGDIVFGDDDGVVIASADRIAGAIDAGEAVAHAESTVRAGALHGRSLHEQTNWAEHVAALDAGRDSRLEFLADAD